MSAADAARAAHPALVLLLADPTAGRPARAFVDALDERLGGGSYRVLPLAELRRAGLEATAASALRRIELERFLAREIAALVGGPGALAPRARMNVFIVGGLSEPWGRRHAYTLPLIIGGALSRVALPRAMHPTLVGVWSLPAVWSPADGAELFAWLKEFARAVRPWHDDAAGHGSADAMAAGYTLATVIGRSDAHERALGRAVPLDDAGLLATAAELVAACCSSRLIDWALALRRGRMDATGFSAFGIEARATGGFPVAWEAGAPEGESRILWPVDPPARTERTLVAHRAIAGMGVEPGGTREEWDVVEATGAASTMGWLVQMAHGLDPSELLGARHWRRFYTLLAEEQRRAAHTVPEALAWPDPLEPPRDARIERVLEAAPPLL